jgi:hypothetical protein
MANYHTFGFCSGRGMFGRAIHSIPISKIKMNRVCTLEIFVVADS